MVADLDNLIHHREDHVLIVDIGLANAVTTHVTSLGKDFQAVTNDPVIV